MFITFFSSLPFSVLFWSLVSSPLPPLHFLFLISPFSVLSSCCHLFFPFCPSLYFISFGFHPFLNSPSLPSAILYVLLSFLFTLTSHRNSEKVLKTAHMLAGIRSTFLFLFADNACNNHSFVFLPFYFCYLSQHAFGGRRGNHLERRRFSPTRSTKNRQ